MAKKMHDTPMLDELESGPWPSFVTGLKRLAGEKDYMVDLMGQLETSYRTRKGYWKGGTVGVFGYGGGVIPRFTELKDADGKPQFPDAAEFHTLRVQPPPGMHYDTDVLRKMCDIWEKHGSGLIAFHGQSGDIMFQGAKTDKVQDAFDELNELGFDLGGAGPAVRTSMSCVGAARCEQSCFDEARAHRQVLNTFLDDIHRPALPYKFKFKFSGCSNDCMNSIQRSDMAVIGTWRDNMRTDEALARKWFDKHGMNELVNDVINRCPTKTILLKEVKDVAQGPKISSVKINDTQCLEIDNSNCVRCMHCINVMTGALAHGTDTGATILVGGKRTLKIGDLMGTVVVPFMQLKTDEDYKGLVKLAQKIIDFFAENALEHERTGEMIERIGLVNFLEGIELEVDPNMVSTPRTNPYVRTDDWDEEAAKYMARKQAAA
ncbi:MAG TPA: dissimilatory-type sulfite reductase subunit alpha [Hydrogenophaga sp.]|jgi:sulfite reductase alpha subunit|uniref:dissimilatory-type sulfite reductase subunit alpha n=1 Tax=Hydrogenophaga sp. TaxID=1904254 RepID=UPI0008D736B9|nr:dissimilatory-type sulfite reductase subunit alpha [Hydrogenophaga sp.]MBW8467539.1 dissimilatory-type sulfite reductase subunit alpha [Thiobacillus sp.]OGA75546.1 MAG: sulfite reductase, dissimilatory-type subunit alpha [Burkholderiales bacterium GWE1_65_30]OGA93672.1 MAG: sulfite reductase, dissimilatory-type subunit alpha [Burkholderiales bacterium GWF1_66_17]OGB19512.1 MAG: sulfite reductase, dissimilatory-type subunit alpha [Burkholderiales bacterium RIFCSPHIGHO2_02_FULL_66_10]OGB31651